MRCLLGNNENGPEVVTSAIEMRQSKSASPWLLAISKVKPAPFFQSIFVY